MNLALLHNLSLALGLLAYLILIVFCVVSLIRKVTGKALLAVSIITFAYVLSLGLTGESILTLNLGLLMQYCWIVLALRAIGLSWEHVREIQYRALVVLFAVAAMALIAGVVYTWWLLPGALSAGSLQMRPTLTMELLLAVTGLVTVEQLVRNTRSDLRWRLRFLSLALGLVFTYALIYSTFALLYGAHFVELMAIYPAVLAIAVPLLIAASLRNRDAQLRFNLSREFAFRTGVLFVTGAALLVISLAGYYARLSGGDVATALAVLITAIAILALLVVIGSNQFQVRLRRFISENFYARKYDYRDVWGSVSSRLTEPSADFSVPQQCIRSFLDVLDATSGALWLYSETGALLPLAQLHTDWKLPLSRSLSATLLDFFSRKEWIIDLGTPPEEFQPTLPLQVRTELPESRFLIPLSVQGEPFGLIVVGQPHTDTVLSWEDYDVLKLISLQTAGFLALREADARLSESRQFDAVNRLSAFVVHDLKTVSAQLSLLTENAPKHKANPAFVDDMVTTVSNANEKLTKLLEQFRHRAKLPAQSVNLTELVTDVVNEFRHLSPQPQLNGGRVELVVSADRSRLAAVIGHTIENAVQATSATGEVKVSLQPNNSWVEVLIEDSGTGMDESFISEKLFVPFESTKGIAGMGMGAYQTREYLRSLGGNVEVISTPGTGTTFTLRIPRSTC